MPASETERQLIRLELAGDATSMPDTYIDMMWDTIQAQNVIYHPTYDDSVLHAQVVSAIADQIWVSLSKKYDYSANTVDEKVRQLFENWTKVREDKKKLSDTACADADQLVKPSKVQWGPFYVTPRYPKVRPSS